MVSNSTAVFIAHHLPPHCAPTTHFLQRVTKYFGICVPTRLGFTSILLGNLSILAWLFAQMPQIYTNYQLQSTAGLSIFFLAEWLAGDATNLIGGILTKQATWQVVLASYYVFVDICLVTQFFWYTYFVPWWREGSVHSTGSDSDDDDDDDANSDLINSLSPINSTFAEPNTELFKDSSDEPPKTSKTQHVYTPRLTDLSCEKHAHMSSVSLQPNQQARVKWPELSPRTYVYAVTVTSLLTQATALPITTQGRSDVVEAPSTLEFVGTIISWFSTVLYLGSRLPQLYKNWKRKSMTGLSPYLFMATFLGNSFYSASMLANPKLWHNFGPYGGHGWVDEDGSTRAEYIATGAPFFLGAFGVLAQDAAMGVQFLMYAEQQEKLVKIRDRQGYGRWRRVSGWMRGWIPSIKKERVVDLSESQRLLSESRELDRHSRHSQYGGI